MRRDSTGCASSSRSDLLSWRTNDFVKFRVCVTQTGNQNTVRPLDCKPVSVRVFFFFFPSRTITAMLSWTPRSSSSSSSRTSLLLSCSPTPTRRATSCWGQWACEFATYILSAFCFCQYLTSLDTCYLFLSPWKCLQIHIHMCAVLLFWDMRSYLTGATFGQKGPDFEEFDKVFISTQTMLCSVYRADFTVCVSVSLCFPGACVSMPSSNSLTRTRTGSWALMSFSTAWNLASIHQRRVSWAGRFSDFKEGRWNWNEPNQTLTQITRDWKLLT